MNWQMLTLGTVHEATNCFISTFLKLASKFIPTKTILVRPDDKPWFDSELRKFCRKRDRFKRMFIRTGKLHFLNKYKQTRNKVNNMKKHAKQTFFASIETNLENLHFNDKRGFWRIIRFFVKNNDCSGNIPPLKSVSSHGDTHLHFSNQEKANCLNEYFASISTVDDSNAELPNFSVKTNSSLSIFEIKEAEIEEIILNLNLNKATGPDLISHKMLRATVSTVSKPLSILFNRSITEGIFPNCWKVANVVPIFKKGERSSVSNYRPVSLLSCCSKLFERIIFKHMYNFFLENNLLYKYQSGFLPNHSTVFQLVDIFHHICQAFDNKQYACMVFCDVSKAFDRVWHKGLLFKLKQNGINGQLLKWLTDYLSGRKQKVTIQTATSSSRNITAGVPQGSVLGPLLFLIYINDISESLLSLTRLFADDSSLYYSASSLNDIEGIINHDLTLLSLWSKQWLVSFNPLKTEAIIFSLRPYENTPVLTFDNTHIKLVENHKHLGVTLNNSGQWDAHIESIIESANKIIAIMRRLKFTLNRRSLNQIYLSYVVPVIEYASIVWDGCSKHSAESLQKIQNEAARVVTGLTRSVSLTNLYRECGWQTLQERRNNQKLCFMYKATHNMVPSYVSDLIPQNVGSETRYPLRNNNDIRIPQCRTSISHCSCIPSSISLWNNLDEGIKNRNTMNSFKHSLKDENTKTPVPPYYLIGNRYASVLHARLRNNCSDLFYDLYNNNLREEPLCSCPLQEPEDADHYLFRCSFFRQQRISLFRNTRNYHPLNANKLLFGNELLKTEDNVIIFTAVQKYIIETKRFRT